MRKFDYKKITNYKWDSTIIEYIAKIHEMKGRQELYLAQKQLDLGRLVESAFKTKIGRIAKSDINELYPTISVSVVEKAIATLIKDRKVKKYGQGMNIYYVLIE